MLFRDIPGQEVIAGKLRSTVHENRVSHAQLFAGREGCGSLAMAFAYARYITCTNRTPDDSCGVCPSCVKHSRLIHPDMHFVFPVFRTKKFSDPVCDNFLPEWRALNSSKPFISLTDWLRAIDVENSQAIIYAAEASEILRKLSLKTYEAEYKTMFIWLPEKMHHTAANKLLKLIEEPPDKTLFLLVSEEPDRIIPTILSRCQMIRFRGVDDASLATFLALRFNLQADRANEIAHISGGNIVRALNLVSDDDPSAGHLETFRVLMRHAWKRDIAALSEWAESTASSGREAQKDFLEYCLELLRGNFVINARGGNSEITFMTRAEADFSEKFHPFINGNNIDRLYEEFNKAHHHIESNGNAKIIFLDLSLLVARLIKPQA